MLITFKYLTPNDYLFKPKLVESLHVKENCLTECLSREKWPGAVVFLYLLGMTLMFAHLGSPHINPPPSFVLPRLLIMAAVAILVWRRGGLPSSIKQSSNVIFEAGMVITACSLALAYVWHLVEVLIYVVLFVLLTVVSIFDWPEQVETLTGVSLTCEDCTTASQLQFVVVTMVATIIFIWVLNFAITMPYTKRVLDNCMDHKLEVRFWSKVKIAFINPKSHTHEDTMEAELSAPGGGDLNPIVKALPLPHID